MTHLDIGRSKRGKGRDIEIVLVLSCTPSQHLFFSFTLNYINQTHNMFLRPNVILNAASRVATTQRTNMVRMATPSMLRMYATLPRDDVQSRVLDVVKSFDKVDGSKVNIMAMGTRELDKQAGSERDYGLMGLRVLMQSLTWH